MSDEESEMPVAESSIGKALKEQCKLDKEMLGMMKVGKAIRISIIVISIKLNTNGIHVYLFLKLSHWTMQHGYNYIHHVVCLDS